MNDTPNQHRVQFDFEIEFLNGGGVQGQEFRLDIEGEDIAEEALADYIVRDLRLLMVGRVRILNKRIITEAHKRTQPLAPPPSASQSTLIELSHTIEDGLTTPPIFTAPCIRYCWAPVFRSSNICAASSNCRTARSASAPRPQR